MNNNQEQIFMFMLMDLVEHDLLTTDEADLTKKIYFANGNEHLIITMLDGNGEAA